jgi:hypothetical protein
VSASPFCSVWCRRDLSWSTVQASRLPLTSLRWPRLSDVLRLLWTSTSFSRLGRYLRLIGWSGSHGGGAAALTHIWNPLRLIGRSRTSAHTWGPLKFDLGGASFSHWVSIVASFCAGQRVTHTGERGA